MIVTIFPLERSIAYPRVKEAQVITKPKAKAMFVQPRAEILRQPRCRLKACAAQVQNPAAKKPVTQ